MAEAKKVIVLRSSDGIDFEVEEDVAKLSKTISNMIENGVPDGRVPLPAVSGKIMTKIVVYAKKHVESNIRSDRDGLKNWDAEFVKFAEVDKDMLFDMLLAAHSLNIPSLVGLLWRTVRKITKGMTSEQMSQYFNRDSQEEQAVLSGLGNMRLYDLN